MFAECVGEVKRDGRAVALLAGFQIFKEPANVGKEQVANLGLILDRGIDVGKWFFKSQCL